MQKKKKHLYKSRSEEANLGEIIWTEYPLEKLPGYSKLKGRVVDFSNSDNNIVISGDSRTFSHGDFKHWVLGELDRKSISSPHFQISLMSCQYYIIDKGSLNGTWLNNQVKLIPNIRYKLLDGDLILLCDKKNPKLKMKFEIF